ncbi:MAG: SDR family NAD(P)-dependent oxidoreductase [Pseudonocardiales bacterium]
MDLQIAGKRRARHGRQSRDPAPYRVELAAEACSVGICDRGHENLNRTAGKLRDHGAKICGVVADVGQEGDVERFIAEAAAALGRVDLLVVNAGSNTGERRFLTSTPQEWRQTFELNVGHAARAVRACVPHMQQVGGGAVVIIASISGWKPAPYPQYGSAKAAEIYFAMELGRELASERIRVNAVSPGSFFSLGGDWDSLP